ncbi:MAG: 16S rRNA (cytosine(967)-C(5))-methyltransferase RsmB [Oscillospiraceae bacterium]|nr:16S rRNA (cytosine(967)-C(5))-methyltransferase RsmB [Oscillospiraceae bacterium]
MTAGDARRLAVKSLIRINREGGYSNIVLDNVLSDNNHMSSLAPAERALLSRLVYGVTERLITLDYVIEKHSSIKLKKIHPVVLELLRLGCYQLLYMDKIPPRAAVNETVRVARELKQERATGFINAVLRTIQREKSSVFDDLHDDERGIAIRTSCPVELIEFWRKSYDSDMAVRLAQSINDVPPLTVRVNTLKTTCKDFEDALESLSIEYSRHPFLPGCYDILDATELKRLDKKSENCYYHQDAASQICLMALGPMPGERLADVCAAPGGKSLTAAMMMENEGEISAFDIYPNKCDALRRRASKMGVEIIRVAVRDGATKCPKEYLNKFDRVLCDVPCSGLGVIRRKPEIKYKPIGSFAGLPGLQYDILHQSSMMVRPGGVLQYSTCTLNPLENQQIASRFLAEHKEFSPRILPLKECFDALGQQPSYHITLFPPIHRTDGFFIAGFKKSR